MMRFRIGKFSASAGVPIANSLTSEALGGDPLRQRAMARRVDEIEPGADDGDRAAAAGERAFVRGAVDAERQAGDDDPAGAGSRCAAKARAFSRPCGVGLRLPTIAIAGARSSSMRPRA